MNAERRTENGQPQQQFNLEERLLDYAAAIIRLSERLPRTRAGVHVAGQMLRSGTSPLANHGEAQDAESADDFIHKFKICLKELRETHRWLHLIKRVPLIRPESQVDRLMVETEELIRIFKRACKPRNKTRCSEPSSSKFPVQCSTFNVKE